MNNNVIILAGGIGSRLWPLSSEELPKQFITLFGDENLLQMSLRRALFIVGKGKIFIVTGASMVKQVEASLDIFAKERDRFIIVAEPMRRNTSAAILLGIASIKTNSNTAYPCLVMASDHIIMNKDAFYNDVKASSSAIVESKGSQAETSLFLFGIAPTRAEVGFGYIKATGNASAPFCSVQKFEEKPNLKRAKKYFKSAKYWWNSGMFHFDIDSFLLLYKKHAFALYSLFAPLFKEQLSMDKLTLLYQDAPKLPVDKAIIEKASSIKMIPVSFDWSDVGGWSDLSALLINDPANTIERQIEGSHNFAMAKKPVTFCGVDNLIIIEGEEGILVAEKSKSHLIQKK